MVEDADNVVLRLLRGIRSERAQIRDAVTLVRERMTAIERHEEDMKESVSHAFGLSARANVAYETTGQRPDRLTERLAGLKAGVEDLERPR